MSLNARQDMSHDALPIIFFDDDRSQLGPLTDLRSVLDQRTGAWTNRQRLENTLLVSSQAGRSVGVCVPERLRALTPGAVSVDQAVQKTALWVNSAWSGLPFEGFNESLLEPNSALVTEDGQTVVMAKLDPSAARAFAQNGYVYPADTTEPGSPTSGGLDLSVVVGVDLIRYPWDVLNGLGQRLVHDATAAAAAGLSAGTDAPVGVTVLGDSANVKTTGPVSIDPGAVLDARGGPILLGAGCKIGALAVLEGPCAVMEKSVVQPHSLIRANTAIGPVCKAAGEVSGSVFQAYSNKAHLGFVGDTLIGSWCNLGANTNVSNLKNTYGPVRVNLSEKGQALDSGRTFQGPVLGDFVRTAIGTHLLTGSVVGTGSMLAVSGYPPKFVSRFRFVTDKGDQVYDMDAFFKTAEAMMARRGLTMAQAVRDACLAMA